jgi:hypothetical protein
LGTENISLAEKNEELVKQIDTMRQETVACEIEWKRKVEEILQDHSNTMSAMSASSDDSIKILTKQTQSL